MIHVEFAKSDAPSVKKKMKRRQIVSGRSIHPDFIALLKDLEGLTVGWKHAGTINKSDQISRSVMSDSLQPHE